MRAVQASSSMRAFLTMAPVVIRAMSTRATHPATHAATVTAALTTVLSTTLGSSSSGEGARPRSHEGVAEAQFYDIRDPSAATHVCPVPR